MTDDTLRSSLVELLRGKSAHVSTDAALKQLDRKNRNARPPAPLHSVWEELEHMRIAQHDILRYTLDPTWTSPEFPVGYWPAAGAEATDDMWEFTKSSFFQDLEDVVSLVEDIDIDLLAEIPHGEGRTYIREILLVADHNAYHTGQLVAIRKALGDWKA